ncbi:MAG: multicopper oxidase domain-containing protein [Saprospiraceae bacterium]|jgi:blue copper oxidase|nr:multicopper oxidase domain-containing protein [Saprospiraceae bacterium]
MKFNCLNKILFVILLPVAQQNLAQTTISIPDTLTGDVIDLTLQHGVREFYPGTATQTIGYNGNFLGPTIILYKGHQITLNLHNQLGDTTTTHWHGLHVAPANDGSPHNPVMAGEIWSPSFTVMDKAATYWYHPHLHGKTLNQVVKGAAGLIIVRDLEETALSLPRTYGVDDVPLVFQWKTFDAAKQIVEMDEADNEVLVNGTINGTLHLPAQVVRLRLLNGSSHRFFNFGFADNRPFKQIASDAGLLDAPVPMTRLILGSGERAEILVDLSGLQDGTLKLRQFGTQLPQGYPGGPMMMGGMTGPKDNTDFDLLTMQIGAPTSNAVTAVPATLTTNTAWPQAGASSRSLNFSAQPMMSMTNFFINGLKFDMETVNFSTQVGKTEIWTITNQTMMAHPFHIHGMHFYVLTVNGATPPANLRGRKDVVVVPPMNGSVKIILRYEDFSDPHIPYMYHCHILSHEDTGMMGQFIVNAAASGTFENAAQEHLRISPTLLAPDLEKVEISAENGWEPFRVEVYDQDGRLLLTERNATRIAADRLAPGMNSILIFTARGTAVFKVVKTN